MIRLVDSKRPLLIQIHEDHPSVYRLSACVLWCLTTRGVVLFSVVLMAVDKTNIISH